jgi:heme/copper-type cytochrome/quinol oxidase subunit 2
MKKIKEVAKKIAKVALNLTKVLLAMVAAIVIVLVMALFFSLVALTGENARKEVLDKFSHKSIFEVMDDVYTEFLEIMEV